MKNGKAVETDNLIKNGDFSTPNGAHWWTERPNDGAVVSFDNQECMTSNNGNAWQHPEVVPSATYLLTCRAKQSYSGRGSLQVSSTGLSKFVNVTSNNWENLALSFETPPEARKVVVKLFGANGEIRFDDVELRAVDVQPEELIKNGDFSIPGGAHWTAERPNTGAVVSFDNQECMTSNNGYAWQDVKVSPSSTYVLTCKAKQTYSGRGSLQVGSRSAAVTSSTWENLELVFETSPSTHSVTVKLFGASGEIRFDNVSMKQLLAKKPH
ncbi:hypothetical protein [Pseudomonas akapageensis]|uniref:hypothetical protein n=1 Tax=Pseudomonas akapageensis TaxID=2609961 RepID=UPI00140DF0D2|nr:hypothetical protein [Pseudomonas akapageensis]